MSKAISIGDHIDSLYPGFQRWLYEMNKAGVNLSPREVEALQAVAWIATVDVVQGLKTAFLLGQWVEDCEQSRERSKSHD